MRRTKVVATLGPATDPAGVVDSLILAGMDCARLNCSHGTHDDVRARALEVREASRRAGRPVALLFDLQGPKLRLARETRGRSISVGERVAFFALGEGQDGDLEVDYPGFAALCSPRSNIVVGDGLPRFQVVGLDDGRVEAIASMAGAVGPGKGVNVTQAQPLLPALTPKDLDDITLAASLDADFIALSFVRSARDVEALRSRLVATGSRARVIAKIEKVEAFENLEEIVEAADGVMVARGDYGVEAGLAHVPAMQKDVIHRAVEEGKLVITATQMLESMITSPEPTRAEALDVYNAVLDGTSATMLSAETGVGEFPVEAVSMMAEIASVAERADIYCAPHGARAEDQDAAVMYAAVALGRDTGAAAIVVPTTTGGTARACAKYRPARPVIAVCHDAKVAHHLALEWGIHPIVAPLAEGTEEMIAQLLEAARSAGGLEAGEVVVITAGPKTGHAGATNLITVRPVP
jgi:pyruvate kinase